MLYIEGTNIKLTRGDTAYLKVPLMLERPGQSNAEYTMDAEDILRFTVKSSTRAAEALIAKEEKGNNVFHIVPGDTAPLKYREYYYDVQLTMSSGDVFTVIPPSVFEVLPEVSY